MRKHGHALNRHSVPQPATWFVPVHCAELDGEADRFRTRTRTHYEDRDELG